MALESTQHKRENAGQAEQLLQMVSFRLGEELFGVDILKVQEINRLMEITKMPKVPDFVEGVINLRGRVIPIVDLRKRFHLPPVERNRETRIIVVDISGMMMGMIVDSVSEVLRLPASTIEPAPDITTSIESQYIRGVAKLEKRLLIFLDLSKVFLDKEKTELDQFTAEA
ncbi:MAG: chemotaxis protein CheW [candidate division Zixibacteria bacterium]|jgi:purine-binding chemotaxis protein CheW|nr:chemotaxis protein CheW [candidate division Zixibacteria bacterium]